MKHLRESCSNELKKAAFVDNDDRSEKVCNISSEVLSQHASLTTKNTRDNQIYFITKNISIIIIMIIIIIIILIIIIIKFLINQ